MCVILSRLLSFCTDHSDIKEAVNKHAFERFEKNVRSAESIAKAEAAGVSKRFESNFQVLRSLVFWR